MKKYYVKHLAIAVSLTLLVTSATAQCTFGNFPPPFNVTGGYGANYLLGTKHTLTFSTTVTGLGYAGNGTGSGIQMAIYNDNAGLAGTLIAFTATSTVGTGNITIPLLSSVAIPPGDYWIMAIYNANLNHVQKSTSSPKTVCYISHTFGTAPPATASWVTYTGQDF